MSDNNHNANDAVPYALTTLDNPFNPFTQFDEWWAFDLQKGYNTCAYLARIAKTSDELSTEDQAEAILDAIDEIIDMNILGTYVKVTPENFEEYVTNSQKKK